MSRARAGDGQAFRALTEPHRRELQVHCYRMLGSLQDAEDALQDSMLAAWRGLEGFDGRASLRTWLYRIATNRCLDALRAARRRPPKEWEMPGIEPPEPSALGEIHWLEPCPDALLDGAFGVSPGPEARYELMPHEYRGRDSVAAFFAFAFGVVRGFELVPTRANRQPAFGVYLRTPGGTRGVGFFVLTLGGNRISALTRFEDTVLPVFGLPPTLPAASARGETATRPLDLARPAAK